MRWLVALSVPRFGTVVDPFAGTGTTLHAARDLERNAIGIELEESFCSVAERRLEEGDGDEAAPELSNAQVLRPRSH